MDMICLSAVLCCSRLRVGLAIKRWQVKLLVRVQQHNNSGQVVDTLLQLVGVDALWLRM